eukprot:9187929-Pyramimonas_sp.AAC.1
MRGPYPMLQRSGEAAPPIPTDRRRRRSGPLNLSLHVCTRRPATRELSACSSQGGASSSRGGSPPIV